MVYCKKCARLLDEDVRVCPYCNSEDDHFVPDTEDETTDLLRQLDEQIARNTITPDALPPNTKEPLKNISNADPPHPGAAAAPPAPAPPQPEYVDPRDIIVEPSPFDTLQSQATANHTYAPGAAASSAHTHTTGAAHIQTTGAAHATGAAYTTSVTHTADAAHTSSVAHTTSAAYTTNAPPSTGMYVGMILLSVFLTLPGLIVGIVYMTNKNAAYRKMGLIMLLVSIGFSLLWCIACCAMFYAVGNAMITTF